MLNNHEQIVSACKRKDSKAMKLLYEELSPTMLGVCMRYTHSRDEAQDLLHDGFIKVFEKIDQLRKPEALVSWVYRIMVSVSIDYVKKNQEIVYCDLKQQDEENEPHVEEPYDLDAENTTVEEIVAILQSLPDRYRLMFNMREVEEMRYEEIAEQLKLPMTTVRSYVSRAKKMIKMKLGYQG